MPTENRGDVRKQIRVLTTLLGVMTGIALYLAWKTIDQQNPVLVAVLLVMFLFSLPLARKLVSLRRPPRVETQQAGEPPGQG